jgi:hypothetical protein
MEPLNSEISMCSASTNIPEFVVAVAEGPVPDKVFHKALWGKVDYCQFPEMALPPAPPAIPKENMQRLFLGQLPYDITEENLNYALGLLVQCSVYFHERIIKRGKKTGCLHAYCAPEVLHQLRSATHSVVFDEGGFWWPSSDYQSECLTAHIATLSGDASLRPLGLPYQTMTVEEATSTFIPTGPSFASGAKPGDTASTTGLTSAPSREPSSLSDDNDGSGMRLTLSDSSSTASVSRDMFVQEPPSHQLLYHSRQQPPQLSFPIMQDPKMVRIGGVCMVHHQLRGEVDYHPFPADQMGQTDPAPPREHLVRLFVGQLPYNLSDDAFAYAIKFTTGGSKVYHIERILKRGRPGGCLYTYCAREDVDAILNVSHRILFDDSGFWAPSTDAQAASLQQHVSMLAHNELLRPVVVPWQTMTVEISRSHFSFNTYQLVQPQHSHSNMMMMMQQQGMPAPPPFPGQWR